MAAADSSARTSIAIKRGAAWLGLIVPAGVAGHWFAPRLTVALWEAASAFASAISDPSLDGEASWAATGAVHTIIALTFVVASLAWLGQTQPLDRVGPPPMLDSESKASSGGAWSEEQGASGTFAVREVGKPGREYCDGAELMDDAEHGKLDPLKPAVVMGGSGRVVAGVAGGDSTPRVAAESLVPLYSAHGLGPARSGAPQELYEDMVRRVVSGCVYQDPSRIAYGADGRLYPCGGFSLAHRTVGADEPRDAMSWVGIRRLTALQESVRAVLDEGVAGDVLECGVLYGGAAAAAKAVLRARGADAGAGARRVLCADTFVPTDPTDRVPEAERPAARRAVEWVAVHVARALALFLPDGAMRWVTRTADAILPDGARSFPRMSADADLDPTIVRWVRCVMRSAGSPDVPGRRTIGPGLHRVRSHFARLGLLDDNVVFLRGFFSASLPGAAWGGKHPVLGRLAVLRLDGDTFESTWTALEGAYARLSVGGFCIIDDYDSFPGCKRAVDTFREERGITAPLMPIDAHAVQWRKGKAEPVEG